MVTVEFRITSPGHRRGQKEIDWEICFICQEEDGSDMVLSFQKKGNRI